jgi:hypothetical protein
MRLVELLLYEEEKAQWYLCSLQCYRPNVDMMKECRHLHESLVWYHIDKRRQVEQSRDLEDHIDRWMFHLHGPDHTGLSDSD